MGRASQRKRTPRVPKESILRRLTRDLTLQVSYRVQQATLDQFARTKMELQPSQGEAGTAGILKQVRQSGVTFVAVERGAGGIPCAVWWVCPGCGGTYITYTEDVSWKRVGLGGPLALSVGDPLLCVEAKEGRCPASPWTLSGDTLSGEPFID